MQACLADYDDISSWLEIVREVEPLFGPMAKFGLTLRHKIEDRSALCVRNDCGVVAGGLLLGGTPPDNWIRWLAVRQSARRHGVATNLIQTALSRWATPCIVSLATFGADNAEGLPARALYERLGFLACEMLPRGPEGGTRQLYKIVRP